MNFKEYDEIIKKHKYDMLDMIIYYNLQCLGYMCDKALENKENILKNDVNIFNTWDLLGVCYE